MIRPGEHPDFDPPEAAGHNKFLGLRNEGHRGVLIALRMDGMEGIVIANTRSADPADGVEWGKLYRVRETNEDHWPQVVEAVDSVPTDVSEPMWEIVARTREG